MMTTVSDNTGSEVHLSGRRLHHGVSELLCFVTDKCNVLPVEGVKVCVDFYSESEIINARSSATP